MKGMEKGLTQEGERRGSDASRWSENDAALISEGNDEKWKRRRRIWKEKEK